MKFILHSVFWGNRHTDLFINYALPSLLGDKSIDTNIKKYEFQFNIFCSSKNFKEIKNQSVLRHEAQLISYHLKFYLWLKSQQNCQPSGLQFQSLNSAKA